MCDPEKGCGPNTHNLHCSYPNCEKGVAQNIKNNSIFTYRPHDFPEDAKYENGCYMNICSTCTKQFIGLKRRTMCKLCLDTATRDVYNEV